MVNWHLLPNEKPIFETETSWKIYWKYYFLAAASAILSIVVWIVPALKFVPPFYSSLLFIVLALILFLIPAFRRRHEMVLITTERVLIRKGTSLSSQRNVEAVTYNNLINVSVQQNRIQKIFGYGDVHFKLSGEEHIMTDIDDPFGIERAVYKIIEKEKEIGKMKK